MLFSCPEERSGDAYKTKHTMPASRLCGVCAILSIRDLDLLTVGLVNDMYIESDNDSENYAQVATQRDYDLF